MYYNEKSPITGAGCAAGAYARTANETCEDAAAPQSPVGECLNLLEQTQALTHDLIDVLERRLAPAMRSPSPQPDAVKSAEPESRLCGEIVGRAASANHMNDKLRTILDRLTV